MPERAVPYLDHPFWVDHYEAFRAEQARYHVGLSISHEVVTEPARAAWRSWGTSTSPVPSSSVVGRGLRGRLGTLRAAWVGRVPFVRPLHPLYTVLSPTCELLESQLVRPGRRILLTSDFDGPLTEFVRALSGRGHWVDEASGLLSGDRIVAEAILEQVLRREPFDVLVAEVTFGGLLKFAGLFRALQPVMARPGRAIVFHFDSAMSGAHLNGRDVITQATVPIGRSEVFFVGSRLTKRAVTLLGRAGAARSRCRGGRAVRTGVFAAFAGASMVLAGAASLRRPRVTRDRVPKTCLAMTIDYELPATEPDVTRAPERECQEHSLTVGEGRS
jgi:hypothetical protein